MEVMMYRLLGKLLVIICAIVTVQTIAYANFADTYGFSAIGISRGNAMTAVVNDWSSVYYNIAGLGKTRGYVEPAQQEQKELTLKQKGGKENVEGEPTIGPYDLFPYKDQLAINYMYTQPQMTIDIPRTDIVADKELNFGTVTLGLVLDLNHFIKMPSFISSSRFGLGLGLMQDGSLVKVYDIDLRTHDFVRYGKEAERAVILAGMGFGFMDDLFGIGVGANVWTGGSGAVNLTHVEVGPDEQTPNSEVQMELTPKIAPIAGIYISPGKKLNALKGLEIGAAYRGEVYMEVDPFATSAELYLSGVNLQMALSIFDYYTPQIISGGIAYTFLPIKPLSGLTISVDVEYQMWSKHRVSKAKETYWAKKGVTIPKFQDIIVPKVGVSYNFGCLTSKMQWLTMNLGYSYRPTYVPDDAVNDASLFNFMDANTHIGSVGFSFTIPKTGPMVAPLVFTIAGQAQMLQQRQVKKDRVAIKQLYDNFDGNPDEDYTQAAIDALYPDYSFSGNVYSGFVEVALRW
jgi:long-chain fatty acid transport protein